MSSDRILLSGSLLLALRALHLFCARLVSYSYSTGLKQFRSENIARPIRSPFNYLICPYFPAYHPFCYHFIIRADNRRIRFAVNTSDSIPYPLIHFHTTPLIVLFFLQIFHRNCFCQPDAIDGLIKNYTGLCHSFR